MVGCLSGRGCSSNFPLLLLSFLSMHIVPLCEKLILINFFANFVSASRKLSKVQAIYTFSLVEVGSEFLLDPDRQSYGS